MAKMSHPVKMQFLSFTCEDIKVLMTASVSKTISNGNRTERSPIRSLKCLSPLFSLCAS